MRIATAQQMRDMDRIAIQERGVPSTQLMERAASAVAETAAQLAEEGRRAGRTGETRVLASDCLPGQGGPRRGPLRAACLCGPGNNGGDGVAAARLLLELGFEVRAVLVGRREKMTDDCRAMEARLEESGGKLEDFTAAGPGLEQWCREADVLVDALFGIGLNTQLRGDALAAVELMNASPAPVVSADIPSGVEADTGRVLGAAVEAAATVTFSLPKAGHYLGRGGVCSGKVIVVDIGIPQDLVEGAQTELWAVYSGEIHLPRRPREGHKGTFGRVYILGGSVGYTGAPVLAAKAAVRSGAGLVSVGVPAPAWPVAAAKLNCAMPHPLPAGKEGCLSLEAIEEVQTRIAGAGVCLIGPGLGRGKGVASVVRHLLSEIHVPVVLDADGINALEGHIDILDARQGLFTILTPHDGEFARLTGHMPGEDRLEEARTFAREHGCCLVLKGHRTITAFPDGAAFVNTTGNPGMAKGGSGDVLAGIIVSLLGQGLSAREAVPAAVCLHGEAGDRCAVRLGEYGMTPADLVEELPQVLLEHTVRS